MLIITHAIPPKERWVLQEWKDPLQSKLRQMLIIEFIVIESH